MEYQIFLLILLVAFIPRTILGHNVTTGKIVVDGTTKIAETDENFICFTLDIWPHDECSQPNLCVWDSHASVLNLVRFINLAWTMSKESNSYYILLINFFSFFRICLFLSSIKPFKVILLFGIHERITS
ncbi:hypothetical protein IC582_017059 [Cucumis melo]